MQTLSHQTRAYICNANGLPGFVFELSLIDTLNDALEFGLLEQALKFQVIDLNIIKEQVDAFETVSQKMNYLKQFYPSLYIFMLKHLKKMDVLEQYRQQCRSHETNPLNYSLYLHGFYLDWLEQQRTAGRLKNGKLSFCNILISRQDTDHPSWE